METTKSGKGFYRYTFWDSLQECELTEASVTDKSEPHIWFGRKRSEHLMNLNQEAVAELLPYLQTFVKTGRIVEEES